MIEPPKYLERIERLERTLMGLVALISGEATALGQEALDAISKNVRENLEAMKKDLK